MTATRAEATTPTARPAETLPPVGIDPSSPAIAGGPPAAEPPASGRSGRSALIGRVLVGAILVATLVSIALLLAGDPDGLLALVSSTRATGYAALGVLACAAGVLLAYASWRVVAADVADTLRPPLTGRVFALSYLGKYVPGRVWGLVTHIRTGATVGVPAGRMTGLYTTTIAFSLLAAGTIGLLVAPAVLGGQAAWLVLPGLLVLACLLRPQLLAAVPPLLARVARRPAPAASPGPGTLRRCLLLALASWAVTGLHVWALALLFGAAPGGSLTAAVGGFGLAASAGFLALVVPDGWGAREAVLILTLSTVLPWSAAGAVAVGSRILCVLGDLAGAGLVLLADRVRPS